METHTHVRINQLVNQPARQPPEEWNANEKTMCQWRNRLRLNKKKIKKMIKRKMEVFNRSWMARSRPGNSVFFKRIYGPPNMIHRLIQDAPCVGRLLNGIEETFPFFWFFFYCFSVDDSEESTNFNWFARLKCRSRKVKMKRIACCWFMLGVPVTMPCEKLPNEWPPAMTSLSKVKLNFFPIEN